MRRTIIAALGVLGVSAASVGLFAAPAGAGDVTHGGPLRRRGGQILGHRRTSADRGHKVITADNC
ncbi:hypothetical protein AB0D65_10035 [Streptomyces griseoloalbus]|uniref:Uncharacterized protein n=1 Tax=Streptomyces griseoloalbus TaxID=67303 RepID=A0ABV3E452_9ACTN